jgi:hypothetical protein
MSKLAQSKRVSTTVYTSGKSFQPVIIGRDYSDFVEQALPRYRLMLLKYLQGAVPVFNEQAKTNTVKNRILSVLTYALFSRNLESPKEAVLIMQQIGTDLNLPHTSFAEELLKDLDDLVHKGQILLEAIGQSGGELVFYQENEPFRPHCHELASGSTSTEVIQYTVTPAYIMKLTGAEEVSDGDVVVKAKVVTYDSKNTD